MHARSAVVDLFGDHLRHRGWWAPVSAVVSLAVDVDVRPPATRTAISRLGAQGWLVADPRNGLRGYAATDRAQERWQGAHARIYARGPAAWDRRWHIVSVSTGGDRRLREQVFRTMAFLGYGRLAGGGWISPRPNPELSASLDGLGVGWAAVHGELEPAQDAATVARAVWDLDDLAGAYSAFLGRLPQPDDVRGWEPSPAYVRRTLLVHEWRGFLYRDPALPTDVLPERWPGQEARRRFLDLAAALAPAASQHVDAALAAAGATPTEPIGRLLR